MQQNGRFRRCGNLRRYRSEAADFQADMAVREGHTETTLEPGIPAELQTISVDQVACPVGA